MQQFGQAAGLRGSAEYQYVHGSPGPIMSGEAKDIGAGTDIGAGKEGGAAKEAGEAKGGRAAQLKHTGLRHGWTTGACATAATTAAYTALLTGEFPDPVTITLPKGQTPSFALAVEELTGDSAMAGIVKDAGDDPDVTHGALVRATVRRLPAGAGVVFRAAPASERSLVRACPCPSANRP